MHLGPTSTQADIDAFNQYLKEDRERRYTPEEIAEMEKLVAEAKALALAKEIEYLDEYFGGNKGCEQRLP